jgi:hypothetical protein
MGCAAPAKVVMVEPGGATAGGQRLPEEAMVAMPQVKQFQAGLASLPQVNLYFRQRYDEA